jgi:hypothetical protein
VLAIDKGLTEIPVSVNDDRFAVCFPLARFLSAEDSNSIVNGEPMSIECRLELWQKRRLWFDRLRLEVVAYAEISYDRWSEKFVSICYTAAGRQPAQTLARLDSLLGDLSRRLEFVFPLEPNDYERESYLAYELKVQYLTPDELGDLKDWLFHGKREQPSTIPQQHPSFAGKLVNLALSSTGFRNRSYRHSSLPFFPSQIGDLIKFPTSVN